ncbi:MAG: UbiA family prenyltransferase [Kiritimatiellae bacterium]|nr:UbiA family prenyltransferase [Kiritimatiellia bacterium]
MIKGWLKFFRVVNLPTVPGDLLVGAAICACGAGALASGFYVNLAVATLDAILIYMAGLADNDVVGASTDKARPIPDGEITLSSANLSRVLCCLGVVIFACIAKLPLLWWLAAAFILIAAFIYNRTKNIFLMGFCRGANVFCGAAATFGSSLRYLETWRFAALIAAIAIWSAYFAFVTKYSEGEEFDEAKKRRVGILIGSVIYIQLVLLMVFLIKPLLIAGAVLLLALRILKETAKGVSAS